MQQTSTTDVPIRHVIFDCGGVIVSTLDKPKQEIMLSPIAERMNVTVKEVSAVVYSSNPLWKKAKVGQLTADEFFGQTFEKAGITDKTLHEEYKNRFRLGGRGVHPEMKSLLADIRNATLQDGTQRRFGLHVLSNYDDELLQVLSHTMGGDEAVKGTFDNVFNSAELHLAKPDPECYRAVVRALGIPPGEEHTVLFIDDKEPNVETAKGLGWKGVVCRNIPECTVAVRQELQLQKC